MASLQDMSGILTTVDHPDPRWLANDLTSLRRSTALLYSRVAALPKKAAT